jgi:hydroxyacylglutathione hydrolase
MAGQVAERLDELPDRGRPLAVVCGTGYRSTVAASVLQRQGFDRVLHVAGGMTAWHKAGLPTVR